MSFAQIFCLLSSLGSSFELICRLLDERSELLLCSYFSISDVIFLNKVLHMPQILMSLEEGKQPN